MTHSKDKTETQKGLKPQISDLNVLTSFNVPKPVCKLGRRPLIFAILPVFLWSVSFQIKKKGILETSLEERGVLEKAKKRKMELRGRLQLTHPQPWLQKRVQRSTKAAKLWQQNQTVAAESQLNHSLSKLVGSEEGSWQIRNWWIQTPKGTTKVWNTPRVLTRWQLFDFVHFITFFPAKSLVPQQLDLSHDINKV